VLSWIGVGIEIEQDSFSEDDHARFKQRLQDELQALDEVLARPGFGAGPRTVGAELELFLVDGDARPFAIGSHVERAAANPLITPEMGVYTIEVSTPPVLLAHAPFSALRACLRAASHEIAQRAAGFGARAVTIGILPTFRREDFSAATITDRPRYRALAEGMRRLRRRPFRICIDGEDPLELSADDVAMEAANIAFQAHLHATPEEFARVSNAAMMMSAPVLAAAGNSPTFLGHRLWHETRVALFKQAGDDRPPENDDVWRTPARIGFGTGWTRDGAGELFRESVALHEPLLPVCGGDEDVRACLRAGGVPKLQALRLHHGTVWKWNRPVYDPEHGGHLRIELRALPSGPTHDDMLANAAVLIGGILALAPEIHTLLPAFPFALAERNFYRAAQHGLDAELAWPASPGAAPEIVRARELLPRLLPRALDGLSSARVDRAEAEAYLEIFAERVRSGVTGAVWQQRALAALRANGWAEAEALHEMLEQYMRNADSGQPVHTWSDLR
jgi:gamma-glutamyl:cysteine ligase YbdK (ATP-grasp superfamily)